MGCFFKSLFLLFVLAIIGLPVAGVVMALDPQPLVQRAGDINTADLKRAQALAESYDPRNMPTDRMTTLRASSEELNTVLKGALGGVKQVAGQVQVTRFGVIIALTVSPPIPDNPVGRHVNITAVVAPSIFGLHISRFRIGKLEIPPAAIRPALQFTLDHLVGTGKAEPILNSIKSVQVAGNYAEVRFQPQANLVADLKIAAKRQIAMSTPEAVRPYIEILGRTADRAGGGRVSMIEFMRPVFAFAKQRSATGDPVAENKAAMVAIAIYFGDGRFERFVSGPVLTPEQKAGKRSLGHVRLNGRHDFVQHFTISMGLALAGGDVAANLIGELKEVKDSGKKSGFSFTDIGADRIGVRFAGAAIASRNSAMRFQEVLSEAFNETAFFPQFADLPEGMSQDEFRSRYGDINSAAYKRVIAEIDRRIESVALYR